MNERKGRYSDMNEARETAAPDLLPARMLNEFVYCPRLFYLEHVQGDFAESSDTVEGSTVHRRVDRETGAMPDPDTDDRVGPELPYSARSVMLSGERCGIIARMDLIEGEGSRAVPVDYKKGEKPGIPGNIWPAERAQLCAQALVLRENGYVCDEAVIYYAGSKERVTVPITDELAEDTMAAVEACRAVSESAVIPPPLRDSGKCPGCSLVGICLPDETLALSGDKVDEDRVRRLYPARDDALPLYVTENRAFIGKKGDMIEVRKGRELMDRARLMEISQVCLFGTPQISTQLVQELCGRDIPVCYFSWGGWFKGITHGMGHKNVELRMRQYGAAADPTRSLGLARQFISAKIRNCRTMLRRNCRETPESGLQQLDRWAREALEAPDLESLRGVEGTAGRIYFMHFGGMLRPPSDQVEFDFTTRNRRPPKDPVNAILSYAYAVLAKDMAVTLLSVGFDPYLGFLHQPRYGRSSLALDLMEEFRPIIADSVAIGLVNNGEVTLSDFIFRAGATTFTKDGKKKILRAYERRMDGLVTHPVFGYTISYRRVLEVQARLLGRVLSGEIPEYPMFLTR
jgi:CRISPR-associated protein Cas1